MKIEKGKLYYDTQDDRIRLANEVLDSEYYSNKIAVHCPTEEDRKFISEKINFKFNDYDSISREVFYLDEEVTSSYDDYKYYYKHEYKLITIDQFKEFYPPNEEQDPYVWGSIDISNKKDEVFNPKPYYDNSKGSLYKVATERGWSSYIFDVVKRLERGGKKDPLRQEIEKSIDVLKIWLNELDE